MKRFLLACVLLLSFIACKSGYIYDLEIRNNSSFTVDFKFNNDDKIYTLNATDSYKYTDTDTDINITLINNPRVDINKSFKLCTLTDMEYKEVHVYNTLSLDIVLCEDNGFIGQTYGETVTVNGNTSASFLLYTDKPNYSAYTIFDGKKASVNISNLIFY